MYIYLVYELRNREYDNCLLLKNELEGRGHSVELINKQKMFKWKHKNGIVLIPNCYRTEDYDFYNYSLNAKNNFIINLQVEQIRSKKIDENGFCIPKGKAKDITHLCWGKNSKEKLLRNKIPEDNLKTVGAIHLDFLREEFSDFWYSREEIAKKYNLPFEKKWILYISSFAYVNNEVIVNKLKEDFGGGEKANHISEFEQLSIISQYETLKYMDKFLENNQEFIIIYRNHPIENNCKEIKMLTQKYPQQFYNISDLNVKQWIQISDQIITWFSTAIIESYVARKMCYILRPFAIPNEIDASIYENVTDFITTYNELETAIENYENNDFEKDFPISGETIQADYNISDIPSYIQIADLIDEYSFKNKNNKESLYEIKRLIYIMKKQIPLKYYIKKLYQYLYKNYNFKITKTKLREKFAFENLEKEIDNEKQNNADEIFKTMIINNIRGKYNEKKFK